MNKIPAINHLQLELHVPDFGPIKNYYSKLGFGVVWEREPEADKGYLVMRMGNTILCFWPGTESVYKQLYFKKFSKETPRGYGVEVIIMVDDIESYYEKVKDVANVVEPLKLQPWGSEDFRAVDPFGYYLRFTGKHNILDNANAVE
ncbi:MAG: glyoxalase/bleomycin resistance/extradiol dioxygenase family protein [bacterium]|nr:glyoxalase/bleomycin resistance/extradiol dioxygenase family protein [bacterium]